MSEPEQPTWEQVLASFEASADAAERLLAPGPVAVEPQRREEPRYDPWQLALPPLPDSLLARARAIQARHDELQERLRKSSAALRQQERFTRNAMSALQPTTGPRSPVFLDRQA